MSKGDKELVIWLGGGIGVLLILAWMHAKSVSQGLQNASAGMPSYGPEAAMTPYDFTNPGFPQSAVQPLPAPSPINVTVNSPTFGWLAPYFPLFGFVGIDSSQIYQ